MCEQHIPEVIVRYDDRIGHFFRCPNCKMLRIFLNMLPNEIEECPKCHQNMKTVLGKEYRGEKP